MRALLAASALLLAGCVAPAALNPDSGPVSLPPPKFDTVQCAREGACAVPVILGASATEVDLAVNPRDPRHLVAITKSIDNERVVVALSRDGGGSWKQIDFPMQTELESDPIVAFAPDGGLLAGTLILKDLQAAVSPGHYQAYRSEDGGETWTYVADMTHGITGDKGAFAVDPARGVVYLAASLTPRGQPHGMHVARSTDSGRTWEAPVFVCDCWYGNVAVGPDGSVHIVGMAPGFWSTSRTTEQVLHSRSDDGGATWSKPAVVQDDAHFGSLAICAGRPGRFTGPPIVRVDPHDGRVHVLFTLHPERSPVRPNIGGECPNIPDWDVAIRSSADGGASWGELVKVNDDDGVLAAQGTPMLALGPAGELHVAWYDQRADPTGQQTEVYYAHSVDGRKFGENVRLTDRPFIDNGYWRDYMGLAVTDRTAIAAFVVAEGEGADVFAARIG